MKTMARRRREAVHGKRYRDIATFEHQGAGNGDGEVNCREVDWLPSVARYSKMQCNN